MEKISAACAMEWSIELEKGLRSKKPGYCIEVIKQISHKLKRWSMEPSITKVISDMYGMVTGEDRLFANAILLRLSDAFCYGDIEVKRCILQVFLTELHYIYKKGKLYNGIVARNRVPNYAELLKRVTVVYNTGDLEAKCLTLRLFGCWADLAKDSTQVRFLILTSLQSQHVSEVKASLFAAGCLSRLSEDFACIALEIMICIMSSAERSSDVKLAAVHAFSKLQCSSSMTIEAYKAGKQILLDLPMEDIKTEMLLSLSKLASETSPLLPEQTVNDFCSLTVLLRINLLLSFLCHEYATPLKAGALRCLYTLLGRVSCYFLANKNVLSVLFCIFDDSKFPLGLQCLALQILKKIFSNKLPRLPIIDMPDLSKLVVVIKNMDTPKAKRGLALNLLVNILCFIHETGKDYVSSSASCFSSISESHHSSPSVPSTSREYHSVLFIRNVSLLIMDLINSLVRKMICCLHKDLISMKNLNTGREPLEMKKDLKVLLSLILCLAHEYPSSGLIAVGSLRCIVRFLCTILHEANTDIVHETNAENCLACVEASEKEVGAEKNDFAFNTVNSVGEQIAVASEILFSVCRFATACLNLFHEKSSITSEVVHIFKDLVDCIKQCRHSCYYSTDVLCFLMCIYVCNGFGENESITLNILNDSDVKICSHSNTCLLHREFLALDFLKMMLNRGNFWEVYRAGKYLCMQGLWFSATFSFRKLIDEVKSDYSSYWIKALMLYVSGESEIKLLLFPKAGLELISSFCSTNDGVKPFSCNYAESVSHVTENFDLSAFGANLARICDRFFSSEEVLEASGVLIGMTYFQRWFVNLRVKVLHIVMEIVGILSSFKLFEEKFNRFLKVDPQNATFLQDVCAYACALCRLSFQLNHLAISYDLLATSFMDIDALSFKNISRLSFCCSTLAFCSFFATTFLSCPAFRDFTSSGVSNQGVRSNAKLIQNLAERLWDIDEKMARKLMQLILTTGEVRHVLCSRTLVNSSNLFDNDALSSFLSAIGSNIFIQANLKASKDAEVLIVYFLQGLKALRDFVMKWMELPSSIPKYFFRVRECIGSELFIFNVNSTKRDELFVRSGSQLSLNLCLQLKNASPRACAGISKIYCVLAVRKSDRFVGGDNKSSAQAKNFFQAYKTEEMFILSEILMDFIRNNSNVSNKKFQDATANVDLQTTFVCFNPNEMGKGFSTCLLNASQLPEGSYAIKWHSCCVDDNGFYWNLISMNSGSIFTVKNI
ncbi:hypothetical protein AXF42_Ash018414 [Apostasia shenzhenica]|uniref:Integrator complex subunit 7 n=1 Tax=Apostasia shenzhenica TaxID=1088818 RepID=A0A2I0BEB4_9ASPA|nr:hypothetical protein AXF42_Ash018414 [Apostasia shenzhenica]